MLPGVERGALERGRLGEWEKDHLDRLADVEHRWHTSVDGGALLHFDLRHDNCIVQEDGTVALVDWGRACRGQAWVDLVCLLLESDLGNRDPQPLFVSHDLGRHANPRDVDAFIVALAGYWTHAAALPSIDGAPQLRSRQANSGRAAIDWIAERWAD